MTVSIHNIKNILADLPRLLLLHQSSAYKAASIVMRHGDPDRSEAQVPHYQNQHSRGQYSKATQQHNLPHSCPPRLSSLAPKCRLQLMFLRQHRDRCPGTSFRRPESYQQVCRELSTITNALAFTSQRRYDDRLRGDHYPHSFR